MVKIILTILCLFPGAFAGNISPVKHALYLSVLEIDHRDVKSDALLNIKVFKSDIEDALRNKYKETFSFETGNPCEKEGEKVLEYFRDHITIEINGDERPLVLESCEKNSDSIWFYFKLSKPGAWTTINVKADYLMELFPTQSNVVSIYNGDQKKFLRITKDNSTQSVSF